MTTAEQALAEIGTYVAACQALGRARITVERVGELSSAVDRLRLSALDADTAALTTAATAAEEALSAERTAIDDLMRAWQGGSGSAARDFLERQCEAASGLLAALVEAGETLGSLRENLARLVEAGADASMRIADRPGVERQVWLAQARSVLQGSADEAAVDAVASRIAAFVDTDIAGDWATAIQYTSDSVAAAYRDALARLDGLAAVRFDLTTPAPTAEPLSRRAAARTPAPAPVPAASAPAATAAPTFSVPLPMPSWNPASTYPMGELRPDTPVKPVKKTKKAKPVGPLKVAKTPAESGPAATRTAAPVPPKEPAVAAAPLPPPPSVPAPQAQQSLQAAQPAAPLPAEAGFEPRTPCEIAADELPQVGQ